MNTFGDIIFTAVCIFVIMLILTVLIMFLISDYKLKRQIIKNFIFVNGYCYSYSIIEYKSNKTKIVIRHGLWRKSITLYPACSDVKKICDYVLESVNQHEESFGRVSY
jgi:hypothetical protein